MPKVKAINYSVLDAAFDPSEGRMEKENEGENFVINPLIVFYICLICNYPMLGIEIVKRVIRLL